MKITTLLENTSSNHDLIHKHGLCLYIESDQKKILFDTGPDDSFIKNANKLDIDLSNIDLVFLSHGHADHGGGIPAFQKINPNARIIMTKAAMNPFYGQLFCFHKYIGLPTDEINPGQFEFISQDKLIEDNIHVFTQFNKNGFTPRGNRNLRAKNSMGKKTADDFSHEIAILITENNTRVLFTGCSHSGVGNMIKTVLDRTGFDKIDMVLGGFHLFNPATKKTEPLGSIKKLSQELSAYPDTKFYTGHCTGKKAFGNLKQLMEERIFQFQTGTKIKV
ncbi:MAG: MBL fold metallo-hydrolase [Desulfobacteraceae bacterium]|nr:MBL fold metallo-hydrolase [Desulfobacteraceae bacterium]